MKNSYSQMIRSSLYPILAACAMLISASVYAQKSGSAAVHRNEVSEDYLRALLRFEPWAESVWKDYPAIPGSGYFGDGGSDGNGGIRGSMSIAFTYSVLIREFPNAPERQRRLKRLEAALRYAEESHESGPSVTVDGKKWGGRGNTWQANSWAAFMGFAAAEMEKELDPQVVAGCKRVVAAEADIRSEIPPATGYKRNTRSEENGWQSNILTLAPAWMPQDPRAGKWIKAAKSYMANTYSVPIDSSGPLKEWISTQTMFPSYTLENHGFFHPSYEIAGGQSLGDSYIMANVLNPALGKELKPFIEHNMVQVWGVVKNILLEFGELAFPSGMDWSLHQFEDVNYIAWMAVYFGMPEAQRVEGRLAKQILHRQEVNGDGRFVGESCRSGAGAGSTDGFYVEAIQSSVIAMAYLHNKFAGFPSGKGAEPANGIAHYADAGLITHRSDKTLTTISYGAKTMSLVYPLYGKTFSQQLFTSPNTSSLIGTDGSTVLKSFTKTSSGLRAEFQLNGIKSGRFSRMIIVSDPEAVVYIEIPSDTSTLREWFLTAIENHPLTGKGRQVIWKGSSAMIAERSGKATPPISTGWVNVDNWMGLITVPEGQLIYQGANDYNREGAAEDAVIFQPKDIHSPRAAIVLPGKDAAYTVAVQKSLRWMTSAAACTISFTLPGGKRKEIRVPLKD